MSESDPLEHGSWTLAVHLFCFKRSVRERSSRTWVLDTCGSVQCLEHEPVLREEFALRKKLVQKKIVTKKTRVFFSKEETH